NCQKKYSGSILDTGTIYPITQEFPYLPKTESSSKSGKNELVKVCNHFLEKYEEFTRIEFSIKNRNRLGLLEMKESLMAQKIFEEAIFGEGTNYINCEYCGYRYDLNKGKCPQCGGTYQKNN
ncbi:MAG: hypothetical protein P8Y18_07375, partial [Candidatus Bathyarchaeota archaeon]